MKGRNVDIHIDRIDLVALPHDGERRLREAVAREIARQASGTAAKPPARAGGDGSERVGVRIASRLQEALAMADGGARHIGLLK